MEQNLIYSDSCNSLLQEQIKKELGYDILLMYSNENWNINDSMTLITCPDIKLAVINVINEITIMEIALLHFLCKPILVTHNAIKEYPVLGRTVNYIDTMCNLRSKDSVFIQWFRSIYARK